MDFDNNAWIVCESKEIIRKNMVIVQKYIHLTVIGQSKDGLIQVLVEEPLDESKNISMLKYGGKVSKNKSTLRYSIPKWILKDRLYMQNVYGQTYKFEYGKEIFLRTMK